MLGEDLGIATENTSKWWSNRTLHGTSFQAGQLVIIDEASLAGTRSLDRITNLAQEVEAKVLLVGDYAQFQSVDAGGVFNFSSLTGTTPLSWWIFTGSRSRGRRSDPELAARTTRDHRHLLRTRMHSRWRGGCAD
ncbi:AAA family ATPase [Corynebacterium flavescens]